MKRYLFIFISFSLLTPNSIGGYAGVGFRYNGIARDLSLAGATVSDGTLGFYSFSNPALLPKVESLIFSSSYVSLSLDRSVQIVSISKNLPPSAGISLSVYKSGTKNIEGRNSINQVVEERYSTSDYYAMMSFGVSPSKNFSIGINIKAFFSSIKLYSPFNDPESNGTFFDIGMIYNTGRWNFGAKYSNIGTGLKWKIDEGGAGQFSYTESIPNKLSLGCEYSFINNFKLLFQEDILWLASQDINYIMRLSSEYNINDFSIRTGIIQNSNNLIPRFGLGYIGKIFSSSKTTFDYSIDFGNAGEGIGHIFSCTINL